MKAAAFNKLIADTYTTPEKSVIVYARLLKEAGLMTTGARGRNAPEMTPLDAARMTIALLTTDGPSQCVERVQRFGSIKFSPRFSKMIRGYETMSPDQFSNLFAGETLEEVLAQIFALPAALGIRGSYEWLNQNTFHLRVFDFDVLAELFQWKMDGRVIAGELVVPFKGETMVHTADGFRPVEGFTPIGGGIRTERSISGLKFLEIGLGLMTEDQKEGRA
ncbi:hypothetical protein [Limimaricola cinnabarinus]|uniref:hypothetical protein n=1 Tax=Limimaricola cinnabarinus TaxID=1125964 RepID=UPI002FE24E8D